MLSNMQKYKISCVARNFLVFLVMTTEHNEENTMYRLRAPVNNLLITLLSPFVFTGFPRQILQPIIVSYTTHYYGSYYTQEMP